ncbi:hypothetical protein JRQ81_012109 [Phrynocephalus forsythii]|uniref:Uncharacterized protein n=1 Tax=Phrynocephalus forsythii TaxID=171643 RepID=A0A9Q0X8H1_9SAUR|nr:hypothetical protein JRQ81_012109 [Phrynocephalus forsythii]
MVGVQTGGTAGEKYGNKGSGHQPTDGACGGGDARCTQSRAHHQPQHSGRICQSCWWPGSKRFLLLECTAVSLPSRPVVRTTTIVSPSVAGAAAAAGSPPPPPMRDMPGGSPRVAKQLCGRGRLWSVTQVGRKKQQHYHHHHYHPHPLLSAGDDNDEEDDLLRLLQQLNLSGVKVQDCVGLEMGKTCNDTEFWSNKDLTERMAKNQHRTSPFQLRGLMPALEVLLRTGRKPPEKAFSVEAGATSPWEMFSLIV